MDYVVRHDWRMGQRLNGGGDSRIDRSTESIGWGRKWKG